MTDSHRTSRQVRNFQKRRNFQVAYDPIDAKRAIVRADVLSPSMTMRPCWQVFAVAIIFLATPSVAEPSDGNRLFQPVQKLKPNPATAKAGYADGPFIVAFPASDRRPDGLETSRRPVILVSNETEQQEPDTDIFALMSGKCSTLKVAGRDFSCRAVAFFHGEKGRTNFTIALNDPTDDSHIISFSGENGRRDNDLYELPIDRMLLRSKDRPKVDGLPVPLVELSAGICKQLGNFVARQISSISCTATDRNGKKYELQFESDGLPITVRRVRQMPLNAEKRSAKQTEQMECRYKADLAKVLPRDRTAYIIGCLAASEKTAPAGDQ